LYFLFQFSTLLSLLWFLWLESFWKEEFTFNWNLSFWYFQRMRFQSELERPFFFQVSFAFDKMTQEPRILKREGSKPLVQAESLRISITPGSDDPMRYSSFCSYYYQYFDLRNLKINPDFVKNLPQTRTWKRQYPIHSNQRIDAFYLEILEIFQISEFK